MSEKIEQTFNVSNMKCGGCVSAVESALNELEDTEVINVSLDEHQAIVKSSKSSKEIADVISSAGFPAVHATTRATKLPLKYSVMPDPFR